MGRIHADTFRRIYILYVLGQFKNGSYGSVRLQKVAYIAERESTKVRPFEYVKWRHGEFSRQMEDVKEQLQSMGYVAAVPLDTSIALEFGGEEFNLGGNRLYLRDRESIWLYRDVLHAIDAKLPTLIDQTVDKYGYLKQKELLDLCYSFPEFKKADEGEVLLESNVTGHMHIDLPDDQCEDLELALNPEFVVSMSRLTQVLATKGIDWSRVREVEHLPFSAS